VPEDVARYSVERAAADIAAVLDHLVLDKARVVGLSMGRFATLHYGLRHQARARPLASTRSPLPWRRWTWRALTIC